MYALDRTGRVAWRTDLDTGIWTTPTLSPDAIFVVADGTLYALDHNSGEVSWRLDLNAESGHVTIGAYHIYVWSDRNRLAAVDPRERSEVWTYTLEEHETIFPNHAPAVVGNWNEPSTSSQVSIYLPIKDGIIALRPHAGFRTSRERWRWTLADDTYLTGFVPANGRLFALLETHKKGGPSSELVALE